MNWYELDEGERIKQVYSKYTIQQFWEWWSDNSNQFMEVRIKDWKVIKDVANQFNLKYSKSGVYVNNYIQLKNVIASVRDKTTAWFGINPKKKNWLPVGFKGFSGKDDFVLSVNFIFIDIDRVEKTGQATKDDLKKCDMLANLILDTLGKYKWNKNYIKICSGNGLQLLIKLDIPFQIPNRVYSSKLKDFEINEDFEKSIAYVREGIGKQLLQFCKRYKKELGVEVDKSCFNIGRVGAIPVTKNFKYGGFNWRGIVELKNGENEGLSDYILNSFENTDFRRSENIFTIRKAVGGLHYLRKGTLEKNPIIRLILDNDLPYGEINNKLWFQFKCLLRDSKFDLNSSEFRVMHNKLQTKLKGNLSTNLPNKRFEFSEDIINKFCMNNMIPPIYPLWVRKTKKMDYLLENINWEVLTYTGNQIKLIGKDIFEDMDNLKKILIEGNILNRDIFGDFLLASIKKYGKEKTKYYFDNEIFYKYLSFE